jgi:hypothetical protein
MQARSLEDCLKADDGIARLSGHAARLLRLQRAFEAAVPRTLARSTRVANFKLGKLVVHADNAAAAAKLRQIVPTLVDVFRHEAAEVTGIEIKVQPRHDRRMPFPAEARLPLGTQAKQGLTSLAGRLPADSPLRAALQRLAKRS